MRRLGAVVLAAGAASRFGRPKQLLRWGGRTLVERAVQSCLDAGCARVAVVTGAHGAEVRAALAGAVENSTGEVVIVDNPAWAHGMAGSIATGVEALLAGGSQPDAALVVLADQPLVDADFLRALSRALDDEGVEAAALGYPSGPGVPACFGRSLFARLALRGSADAGARAVLRDPAVRCRVLDAPRRRRDVDTPADWAQFLRSTPSEPEWITGPVHTGKTTRLAARIAADPDRYCGLLAPVDAEGVRSLRDVVTGEQRRLTCAADAADAVAVGRFTFHAEVFAWGRTLLRAHHERYPRRSLVIDELGKLELRGEGLAPTCWAVIAERRATGSPRLLVVRDNLATAVEQHTATRPTHPKP